MSDAFAIPTLPPSRLRREPKRPGYLRRPGAYLIPSAMYHADPAPAPSLSHSIIRLLLKKTPMHAREAHPRLTPSTPVESEPTEAMERGTIMHRLILGRGEDFTVIAADNYRTKAAKEAAAAARAARRVPVLAGRFDELRTAARRVMEHMRDIPDCADFFGPGASELTMLWREGPVWSRALADRVPDREGAPIYDLKSTARSAAPEDFAARVQRELYTASYWYRRGAAHVLPGPRREYRFVPFEIDPPYAVSLNSCGETFDQLAERDIKRAVIAFATGLITKDWPGYRRETVVHEAPPHLLAAIEELSLNT